MITIKELSFSYKKSQAIIDDLNLQLPDHCIHGIVGLNGSGKTTLLNCIFGLLKPDGGEIFIKQARASKKLISYLPTENFFYSHITGREYLEIFKNNNFDTDAWNALFILPLDDIIDSYSTGMKKKLALMGILKTDKPMMILDEPFNGLDIETSRIIRRILLKLKAKGKTIIITSHIIETLTNMCDYIHYLEEGKIKYSKEKKEFKAFEEAIFSSIENKNKGLIDELMG
ncbi:MAG: ATP-binding cassette domain-containing protein [Bacteroidales bacterium]|nr:ATP-binding cassette domain-containing protein [Bacteroidales bacterium]